ncbi:MAG: hypothetical protein QXX95_01040 [Nitrososphaerales archaeon]
MEKERLRKAKENWDVLNRIINYISLIVILIIVVYSLSMLITQYLSSGAITVGQWLVELEWPLPYFAKPISYLSVALVVFWFSYLELKKDYYLQLDPIKRRICFLLALIFAFVSLYETFYNFMVWNALITSDAIRGFIIIDAQNLPYPNPKIPWNLPFATKLFSSIAAMSLYSLYFFHKHEKKRAVD